MQAQVISGLFLVIVNSVHLKRTGVIFLFFFIEKNLIFCYNFIVLIYNWNHCCDIIVD